MSLICYVVEVRQILGERPFILTLLQDVLSFVPVPSLVYLTKVLHYQGVRLDSILALAENTKAFRVNTEMRVDFPAEILDSPQQNMSYLLVLLGEVRLCLQYVVEGQADIVPLGALLLNSVHELLLDKFRLRVQRNVPRHYLEKVDSRAEVDTPGCTFFNIITKENALVQTHLSIVADRRVAATLRPTLYLLPPALTRRLTVRQSRRLRYLLGVTTATRALGLHFSFHFTFYLTLKL